MIADNVATWTMRSTVPFAGCSFLLPEAVAVAAPVAVLEKNEKLKLSQDMGLGGVNGWMACLFAVTVTAACHLLPLPLLWP